MLHTLTGYHIVDGIDQSRKFRNTGAMVQDHVVIMSKYPISDYQFHPYALRRNNSLLAPFFEWYLNRKQESVFQIRDERGVLSADILIDGKCVRVFSAHLTFWRPEARLAEYEVIFRNLDLSIPPVPNIVCGDFNTFQRWPRLALNLLTGSWPFARAFWSERTMVEKLFKRNRFSNPLSNKRTLSLFGSPMQLDHILVSSFASVTAAEVGSEMYGSDHYPVYVDILF